MHDRLAVAVMKGDAGESDRQEGVRNLLQGLPAGVIARLRLQPLQVVNHERAGGNGQCIGHAGVDLAFEQAAVVLQGGGQAIDEDGFRLSLHQGIHGDAGGERQDNQDEAADEADAVTFELPIQIRSSRSRVAHAGICARKVLISWMLLQIDNLPRIPGEG